MSDKAATLAGTGPHGWIWEAIASGDLTALRAAPADFDVNGFHAKYGCTLTAFLQGMLNLEGRFIDGNRRGIVAELIDELGRRGARPDLVMPSASFEVEALYKSWQIRGDTTALQVVIQIRNDYMSVRWEEGGDADAVQEYVKDLNEIIDKYAELAARNSTRAPRSFIPDVVVSTWERCRADVSSADVEIVSPDGSSFAHALVLRHASPVLSAMLGSEMSEGLQRRVNVEDPKRVVQTFLDMLYSGCLPQAHEPQSLRESLSAGLRVSVVEAFKSSNQSSRLLQAGSEGEVVQFDAKGDALVKFDNLPARQWVAKRNFSRLGAHAAFEVADQLQEDLAGAFEVCQRWQVTGLADVLAERLERGLRVGSFATTLEAAVLHDAVRLRSACLAFAQRSAQVRASYDAKSYSPAVMSALRTALEGTAAEADEADAEDGRNTKRLRLAL
eukprot:gb/GFBE01009672.1/.p1 GENE.gb/GFBE01009672.1/~~gb/GFBE01009672.1/.p1  ORF type:complete len:444 (+),score=103.15 gb/GFBE01009672.1/:1-1332(+)